MTEKSLVWTPIDQIITQGLLRADAGNDRSNWKRIEPVPVGKVRRLDPEPLWKTPLEIAEAYQRAEPRINRSQRYSLTVTEPKEGK